MKEKENKELPVVIVTLLYRGFCYNDSESNYICMIVISERSVYIFSIFHHVG